MEGCARPTSVYGPRWKNWGLFKKRHCFTTKWQSVLNSSTCRQYLCCQAEKFHLWISPRFSARSQVSAPLVLPVYQSAETVRLFATAHTTSLYSREIDTCARRSKPESEVWEHPFLSLEILVQKTQGLLPGVHRWTGLIVILFSKKSMTNSIVDSNFIGDV